MLLNGPEGFGSIKITDLIKAKELINIHHVSIIAISKNVKQTIQLKFIRFECV
ncbi:MAG: hypothetical protein K0B10_06855 [Vicingaceae bacterium]|nr:hypothetical protein [Vicingaceae bacterium]